MTVLPLARPGRLAVPQVVACVAGLGGALCLRLAVAGPAGVGSVGAGLSFAVTLLVVAVACGGVVRRPRGLAVVRGLAGAALLCIGPLASRAAHGFTSPGTGLLSWAVVVVLVAVTEELLLRGVLFTALQELHGPVLAVGVTSLLFAVLHVPLYGWQVVPLDLLVGVWLGLLRLWDGSVTTPAVAHAAADLGGWWLR